MTLTQWNFEQLELGEGARWINGRLVVVDLLAGRVLETRGDVPAPFQEIAKLPVPVGAVAPVRDSDGLIAAFGTGAGLLDGPAQTVFAGDGFRVNDAVADPEGRFWVTTMAYDTEPGTGAVHRLGSPSPVLKGLTIPNGPAFTHDGRLMYLADSARGLVHRFDVDRDGELSGRHVFLHTPRHTPDGMTTDVAGNVWIAFWGSSFVADPFGIVVAEASTDREEILVADVDAARIEEVRRNWPFLRDRRIDAYSGIDRRFLD